MKNDNLGTLFIFLAFVSIVLIGVWNLKTKTEFVEEPILKSDSLIKTINHQRDMIDSLHFVISRIAIIDSIKKFEGFVGHPYECPKDCWLIGYGHKIRNNELTNITKEEAHNLLIKDFDLAINITRNYTGLRGAKLVAISHFVYNVGIGSFLKSKLFFNVINNIPIDKEISRWSKFNGKTNNHLLKRRLYELELYNQKLY